MKSSCVVCLLVLMAIATFTEPFVAGACTRNRLTCQNSEQCCSRCCHNGRCNPDTKFCLVSGSDANKDQRPRENPCLYRKCSPGEHCVVQQVQCFRAPCLPVAVCVPQKPCNES